MKSTIRFGWFTVFAALIHSVAANEAYKFDSSRSTIGFRVHQFFVAATGKFTRFSGNIDLDRKYPERSSVSAKIQVSTINTGIKQRDDHLRSPEFFNVAKFPEITFRSRSVKQTGPQSGDIVGDLTMHGVTKLITLHVKLTTSLTDQGSLQRTRWEVTTDPLNRRDFGLVFGSATEAVLGISHDVPVKIDIEAVKSR
jgi:polyisoprenoid-binding protein YceI